MRTWLFFIRDPLLPVMTVVGWPLIAAIYAARDLVPSGTVLIASIFLVIALRSIDDDVLRPLIPASFVVSASVIFATQAWTIGLVLMVGLPLFVSVYRTLSARFVGAQFN